MFAKLDQTYKMFYKNMGFGVWFIIFLCWLSSEQSVSYISRMLFLLSCFGYIGRKKLILFSVAVSCVAAGLAFSGQMAGNIAVLMTEAVFLYDMYTLYYHPDHKVQIKEGETGYIVLCVYMILFIHIAIKLSAL